MAPRDPWILGAVVLGLAVASAVACFLPARQATRVDVATVLRSE